MNDFGKERNGSVQDYGSEMFNANRTDVYKYFLNIGPLKNTQSKKYFDHRSYIWNEYLQHDTYDDYWRSRNIRPHLKNINIPTLVVGGWFDAEDLFGALHTYEAIEKQSPKNNNRLVMGPWTHGAWASPEWTKFGSYNFGSNTSKYFQDSLQTKFFNYYLKDKGDFNAAEATVFETGTNEWKTYDTWPPKNVTGVNYYLNPGEKLTSHNSPLTTYNYTEYISDPKAPVPYTNGIYRRRNNEYMVEDQRFTDNRPDVISFETDTLTNDITLAGRIMADLFVSTTGTDADFIVKVIDVLPDNEITPQGTPRGTSMGGFERLVRAEVMRGKFRNSYEKPEPFAPNKISEVKFELNDVLHTFKKGHRIMVQVQSSWFPLVDMNPQKFMRIPDADEKDFQKAIIRVYHDGTHASKVVLPVLNK
jgi:putative CocE/NonD family hydrolase